MAGGARAAAHYPAKFCKAPVQGDEATGEGGCQWTIVGTDHGWPQDKVSEATHVPETWKKSWDDISAKVLRLELVHAAREEELEVVDEMGVWEVRPSALR